MNRQIDIHTYTHTHARACAHANRLTHRLTGTQTDIQAETGEKRQTDSQTE
jgi:hypothetical protein